MDFLDDDQRARLEAGNQRIDRQKAAEDRRVEQLNNISDTVKDLKSKLTPSPTGILSKIVQGMTGMKPARFIVREGITPMVNRSQSRKEIRERIGGRLNPQSSGLGDFNSKSAAALGVGALISYILIKRFT